MARGVLQVGGIWWAGYYQMIAFLEQGSMDDKARQQLRQSIPGRDQHAMRLADPIHEAFRLAGIVSVSDRPGCLESISRSIPVADRKPSFRPVAANRVITKVFRRFYFNRHSDSA